MSKEPMKGKSSENISKLISIGKKTSSFDDDEPQTMLEVKENERFFWKKKIQIDSYKVDLEKAVSSVWGLSISHLYYQG